jgi:hypothetical protein
VHRRAPAFFSGTWRMILFVFYRTKAGWNHEQNGSMAEPINSDLAQLPARREDQVFHDPIRYFQFEFLEPLEFKESQFFSLFQSPHGACW